MSCGSCSLKSCNSGAYTACTTTCGAAGLAFCDTPTNSCKCQAGYSGDGKTCVDVDECSLGTDNCSAFADCANAVGSFVCTCKMGYAGNGVTCEHIYACGQLDASTTQLGAAQRLVNLGYLAQVVSGAVYSAALKKFQGDNGLAADGALGPMSAAKLVSVNGC